MNYNFDNPNNLSDAELVRLVQCQDETAFTEMVARYSPRIWNIVVNNSRQKRDAEEILMDVWFAVWQNIIGLRNVESFGVWLRRIAINACNRYYASKSNQHAEIVMSDEDLALQIEAESEKRFQNARLCAEAREAVQHLPQKVRSIGEKYYLDLLSVREITAEFDMPIGTVKSRLSEVRLLLRKEFGVESTKGKTMSPKNDIPEIRKTKCKIVGVGGAGCNAVKQIMNTSTNVKEIIDYDTDDDSRHIEFYAVDTDIETLNACNELTQIQLGVNVTQGQGTDGNIQLGRRAAAENIDELQSLVSDAEMLFIVTGLEGGTGTAVAPIIASIARAQKTLTVCITTSLSDVEGEDRAENAEQSLMELRHDPESQADAIIMVPFQNILDSIKPNLQLSDILKENSGILGHCVSIILDVISFSAEINVSYEDIQDLFRNQGTMFMGIGNAKGEDRARKAAENAINSPLFQENSVPSDASMLVNISAPRNFTMSELDQAMRIIVEEFDEGEPIFGLVHKDEVEQSDDVLVTIIASGVATQDTSTSPITPKTTKQDDVSPPSSEAESQQIFKNSVYNQISGIGPIPESVQLIIDESVSDEKIDSLEFLPE